MPWYRNKFVAYVLLFSVSVYTITGCSSSSEQYKALEKYGSLEYVNAVTYYGSKEEIHRSVIEALQKKGFVLSMSDAQGGVLNGEKSSNSMLLEERYQIEKSEELTTGQVILRVVAFVLIFGVVMMLFSGSSDSDSDSHTETSTSIVVAGSEVTRSYKYIATFREESLSDTSTSLHLSLTRLDVENGTTINTFQLENKYLTYGLFDAVQEQLEMKPIH